MKNNPFKVLGLKTTATLSEIKRARNRAARQNHPDFYNKMELNEQQKSTLEEQMKIINEAYEILVDSKKREVFSQLEEDAVFNEDQPEHTLPALGGDSAPHSELFRQQHRDLIQQFCLQPLKRIAPGKAFAPFTAKNSFNHLKLKSTHSSSTRVNAQSVFEAIVQMEKAGMTDRTPFHFEKRSLTPEWASAQFCYFLSGRCYGKDLVNLIDFMQQQVKQQDHKDHTPFYEAILRVMSQAIPKNKKLAVQRNEKMEEKVESNSTINFLKNFIIDPIKKNWMPSYGNKNDEKKEEKEEQTPLKSGATRSKQPDPNWIALQQITHYAQQWYPLPDHLTLMLQNRFFRAWAHVVFDNYCRNPHQKLSESLLADYDGYELVAAHLSTLKSRMNKNFDNDEKSQLLLLARNMKLLLDFENFFRHPCCQEEKGSAQYYREIGFLCLDWLPALRGRYVGSVFINLFMRAGLYFQLAAQAETDPAVSMADHQLAQKMYLSAFSIAHHSTPDIELSCLLNLIRPMAYWPYQTIELTAFAEMLQKRAQSLFDFFPLATHIPLSIEGYQTEDGLLTLMQRFIQEMVACVFNNETEIILIPLDHPDTSILYQAYEASLKGWYQSEHDAKEENRIRLLLMDRLLAEKGWTFDEVEANLITTGTLLQRTTQHWISPVTLLSRGNYGQENEFKSMDAIEIDFKTGQVTLLATPCETHTGDCFRAFNVIDIEEMIARNFQYALFSLDPIDSNKRFHPFNTMRFIPSNLHNSRLGRTLLATDYLLKMFTTAEVQGTYPYQFRPLDAMTASLPRYLKQVITHFHQQQQDESTHRFWIEATTIEVDIPATFNQNSRQIFRFGAVEMEVRKHKMCYDQEGNLIDDENEGYEGWHCYLVSNLQKQAFDRNSVMQGIKQPAVLMTRYSRIIRLFHKNQRRRFNLRHYDTQLSRFFEVAITLIKNQGEITDQPAIGKQRYQLIKTICQQANVPTYFSPEHVFAKELTRYYDEFALYFPDLNRLKILCQLMVAVRTLAGIHKQQTKQLGHLNQILSHLNRWKRSAPVIKDHYDESEQPLAETYKKIESGMQTRVTELLASWRSQYDKSEMISQKRRTLNEMRAQIGSLTLTAYSDEVNSVCDRMRSEMLNQMGYEYSHQIDEEINKQRDTLAQKLSASKRSQYKEQLNSLCSPLITKYSSYEIDRWIDCLLDQNEEDHLAQALVNHEIDKLYDEMADVFGGSISGDEVRLAFAYNQSAIKRLVQQRVQKEFREFCDHSRTSLQTEMDATQRMVMQFLQMGFRRTKQDDEEEEKENQECRWVPAAIKRSSLAHNRFSFVYGGVALNPRVQATHLPNQSQSRPVQVGGGRGGNGGGHGGGSSGGSGGGGGGLRVSGSGPNRKVAGFQDHHIISHTNRHTKGHELITLAGANLQSRQNRIFLPTHASHHPSRSIHCGRHWSRNYSWQVADKMDKTVEKGKAKNWSQQQYKQAYDDMLKGIRIGLRQGTVALNSNARPGARPVFS